jgi:hypothetical protein
MSTDTLFPLLEKEVTIRGKVVRIRELTHAERINVLEGYKRDEFTKVYLPTIISMCCVTPAFTIEQAASLPGDVVPELGRQCAIHAGLWDEDAEEKKEAGEGDQPKKD